MFCCSNFWWVFDLVNFFVFSINIWLIFLIVESWWVIIIFVCCVKIFFNVDWIKVFVLIFKLVVVLLSIKIFGLWIVVWVNVNNCFWLFEMLDFCFCNWVLYFWGNLVMNLFIFVFFVDVLIFLNEYFFLRVILFFIFLVNKNLFCRIILICFCNFVWGKFLILILLIKILFLFILYKW